MGAWVGVWELAVRRAAQGYLKLKSGRGRGDNACMSGDSFAVALADRVQSVVPKGFTMVAEDGWVRVRHGDDWGTSTGVATIMGDGEGTANAAWAVLNSVQDYISEELREPWPAGAGGGTGPRRFFQPEAVVEGSVLRMWFGERSTPTLEVSEIDLSELR